MTRMTADPSLDRAEPLVGFFGLLNHGFAQLGILHLLELLGGGAGCDCAPCGTRIVEIPVLEREGEAAANRARLAEDRQAFRTITLDPAQAAAMNLRILAGRYNRLPQQWATRNV